jgi:hypothetical protein
MDGHAAQDVPPIWPPTARSAMSARTLEPSTNGRRSAGELVLRAVMGRWPFSRSILRTRPKWRTRSHRFGQRMNSATGIADWCVSILDTADFFRVLYGFRPPYVIGAGRFVLAATSGVVGTKSIRGLPGDGHGAWPGSSAPTNTERSHQWTRICHGTTAWHIARYP